MKLLGLIIVLLAVTVSASSHRTRGYDYSHDRPSEDFRRPNEDQPGKNTQIPEQDGKPFIQSERRPVENLGRPTVDSSSNINPTQEVRRQNDALEKSQDQGLGNPYEGTNDKLEKPQGYYVRRRVVKKVVPMVRNRIETDHNGNFNMETETGDGIRRVEQGSLKQMPNSKPVAVSSGTVSWTSPEGVKLSFSYTADENGFHPVGDHLPTPPPTPEAILKSLTILPKLKTDELSQSSESPQNKETTVNIRSGISEPFRGSSISGEAAHSRRGYQRSYQNYNDVPRPFPSESSSVEQPSESQGTVNQTPQIPAQRPPVLPPAQPTNTLENLAPAFPEINVPAALPVAPTILPAATRPPHTIIEAPLVPILVGPPPIPLRTNVQTRNFFIDSNDKRTVYRIGTGRAN